MEGYFLLRLLGIEASLPMVVAIETISILANNMFFFIPARLGGSDGGKILAFRSMGMTSELGLTFGLLRRAREIFYVALGFIFLMQMNPFRDRRFKGISETPIMGAAELSTMNEEEGIRA